MKLQSTLVALATLISASACANGWATGFQVGGGGTFGTVTFHANDIVFDDIGGDPDTLPYAYDMVQQAEGGNVFVGYGYCWCDRFRFTPQFDAYFLGSTARRYINEDDINEILYNNVRSSVILDLSLRPGILVANCLLLELKAGVSWARVRQSVVMRHDSGSREIHDRSVNHRWPTGYTVGTAARVGLTECLTGYVAFDWHGYWSGPSSKALNGSEQWFTNISHFHAKTFSFGVSWSW